MRKNSMLVTELQQLLFLFFGGVCMCIFLNAEKGKLTKITMAITVIYVINH